MRLSRRSVLVAGLLMGSGWIAGAAFEVRARENVEPLPATRPASAAPRIANYELSARLDPETHRVLAHGTIRWTNDSSKAVEELWFHLYLNAFRNEESLFLRTPSRRARSGLQLTDPGWVRVERLTSKRFGGRNLWKDATTHSPGDPEDATDIRVQLPAAVEPGETLELDVEFESKLPSIVERTGFFDSFHLVSQWFPKLARLEPDGEWAHFAFHPFAEFYADFGDYDVTLDVPEAFVVGSTGREVTAITKAESGRRLARFIASGVHDFAFTAWDGFSVEERVVDGVSIRLLAPPGMTAVRRATFEALRVGFEVFSERYGSYPYETLTVVHPPAGASAAGGMEYPTFITTGGPAWAPVVGLRTTELVTLHEFAHQWFQGMLASNETAYPFLDEGLTSYAEWQGLRAGWGDGGVFDAGPWTISREAISRVNAGETFDEDVIAQPASEFSSFRALASLVYARTATTLVTLGGAFGKASLDRALRRYALTQRFGHPTPDDLVAAVELEIGDDAARALRQALFERGTLDFRATKLDVTDVPASSGTTPSFRSEIHVIRDGSLELPALLEVEYEDGHRTWHRLQASKREHVIVVVDASPARVARVDPKRRLLLDDDLLNNTIERDHEGSEPSLRTEELGTHWASLLLHALGI